MKRLLIFTSILMMYSAVWGQEMMHYRLLSVTDSIAVAGAHILMPSGAILAVSAHDGSFSLARSLTGLNATITHITFEDTVWTISHTGDTTKLLYITPRAYQLPHFALYANPVNILPEKPWYIADYRHTQHGLLLLAYPNRRITNQSLYLLDHNHRVTAVMPWREQGTLYQDAAGYIWLKGRNHYYSVQVAHDALRVGAEKIPAREFDAGMARVNLIHQSRYYFAHYSHDNQWLDYYCFDAGKEITRMVESAYNPLGLRLRETRHFFEEDEFDRRFADMAFFAPVYAPIFSYQHNVVIFNFGEGRLMFFDSSHHLVHEAKMSFHTDRRFTNKLLKDHVKEKFYVVFEERGIITLHELDPVSGKLVDAVAIPSFLFIENITVHNARVYFLYNEDNFFEYKKLFVMDMPRSEVAADK